MGSAFADWYCAECDDDLMIDGDELYFGGPCRNCGAAMTNERPGDDEEDGEEQRDGK